MADALTKKALNRLGVFTTFLGTAAGNTGFLGGAITEVGIPHARADTSPPAAYVADVPLWQNLLDAWYTAADDAGLWVTPWASGQWGDYNLGIHTNTNAYTPTGTNIDRTMSPGAVDVAEAHPVPDGATYRRGVNLAGLDFGHKQPTFTNDNPGGLNDGTGLQFFAPTAGDVVALAARRITTIRLPVNWERLQPTLLGALNTTYLGYVTAVADACAANGVGLIIELHNYARYEYNDSGTKKVLVLRYEDGIDLASAGPTGEDAGKIGKNYLIDVWRRLSDVYRTHAGVVAYELMNEPHDVAPSAGTLSGTTLNDWNDGTVQSWAGGIGVTLSHTTSAPYEGSGALRGAGTVGGGGGFTAFRAERGSVSGTGNVLRGRVRLNGSPGGTWQARFEWQNSGFTWQTPASVTTLTPGVWVEVVSDFTSNPIAGSALNLCLQVQSNNPTASQAVTFDLDLFERGSLVGALTDVQAWEQITQAVLDDLRSRPDDTTKRDTKTVLVPGMGWNVLGWNHPTAWITEPVGLSGTHLYVTHHYFDSTATGGGEGEGVYQTADKRYADAKTYAVSQGFTDDADATAPTLSAFGVGAITETEAVASWTTGENTDQRVEYGLDNALSPLVYGSSTPRGVTLSTSHDVTLTGLVAGATYRVRARSRDAAGNLVLGPSTVFSTLSAAPPEDPEDPDAPPVIGTAPAPFEVRMKRWDNRALYANSGVYATFMHVAGTELDAAHGSVYSLLAQFFLDTTDWALPMWESEMGLVPREGALLQERREAIRARMRGLGTATLKLIKSVGEAYLGGTLDVVEDYPNYRVIVQFVDIRGVPLNLADVQEVLRSIVPAHLTLEYVFRYSTWDSVDAADLTWDEVDALALTWDQWDVQF